MAFGGILATRVAIIAAAIALVGVARRLKLVISTKTVVVHQTPALQSGWRVLYWRLMLR